VAPSDVGLKGGIRRRTPGLRREEIAELAGVGATWYTWLEQGRDVRASDEVLSSLADALRLDSVQRRYLFDLTGRPSPSSTVGELSGAQASLQRMMLGRWSQPAYVLNWRWDVLAWNRPAELLFGDYGKMEAEKRNILHMIFNCAEQRGLHADWQGLARNALAVFRAESVRHLGHPDYDRLIGALMASSREFQELWRMHDVHHGGAVTKHLRHPRAGRLVLEYNSFTSDDPSGAKLVVFTPLDQEDSVAKLRRLMLDSVASEETTATLLSES
jgi:transcriptional regulator with XRE-family HTH domain